MQKHTCNLYIELFGIERELCVTFTYTPGSPAVMWGDNAHPEEGPEIEIYDVAVISPARGSIKERVFPGGDWLQEVVSLAVQSGDLDYETFRNVVED